MKQSIYPISSPNSAIHAIKLNRKTTLCGVTPPRYWEMQFEAIVYPEFTEFGICKANNAEGFWVIGNGRGAHISDYMFCPKCYAKMKQIFNIPDSQ